MKDLNLLLQHRMLEATLIKRIPEDTLQLNDELILAVINQQKTLTQQQAKSLINSPLTILRFKHLYNTQQATVWIGSEGLLLAAASKNEISSLSTTDQLWALHFLPIEQNLFNVILKCQADDSLLDKLIESEQKIQITDHKGNHIFQGVLDDEGELEAKWPFQLSPRHYFQEIGEGFRVTPQN